MLQDPELGRSMVLECIAGAQVEPDEGLDIPTTHLQNRVCLHGRCWE